MRLLCACEGSMPEGAPLNRRTTPAYHTYRTYCILHLLVLQRAPPTPTLRHWAARTTYTYYTYDTGLLGCLRGQQEGGIVQVGVVVARLDPLGRVPCKCTQCTISTR